MRAPLLVTGMPRSGTTWLARLLASTPYTALTGREPMNPRGRQYALAGTLSGWTRLTAPTRRQEVALGRAYRGHTPWVYSRYGHRQWAAPAPWTRIVVKDPFAMLSIPAVHRITGARSVLLYRHPGAVLTSYQRMGWTADVHELRPIITDFVASHGYQDGLQRAPDEPTVVAHIAWFWNALYGMALHDIAPLGRKVTVLAHEEVAAGGLQFVNALYAHLSLRSPGVGKPGTEPREMIATALHNFNRNPAEVAKAWERRVSREEREELEERTRAVRAALLKLSFRPFENEEGMDR